MYFDHYSTSILVAYYSGDLFFSLFYKIPLFLSKKNLQIFLFSPFLFLRDEVRSDLCIYQKQKLTSFDEIVALNNFAKLPETHVIISVSYQHCKFLWGSLLAIKHLIFLFTSFGKRY